MPSRIRRRLRTAISRPAAILGSVLVLIVVAACSSSNPGGTTTTSGTSSAEVAAARTIVANAVATPRLPNTTPLTAPPPTGKLVINLPCPNPQCQALNTAISQAAAAAGWQFKSIAGYDLANPATLVAGMKTALQYNPTAVIVSGVPQALWQTEIADYQKADVTIIPIAVGDVTTSKTVPIALDGTVAGQTDGKLLANWVIQDSNGTGQSLVVNTPEEPVLQNVTDGFDTAMTACSGCKSTLLNVTLTQVGDGTVNQAIVSELQKHPEIKYVQSCDGLFTQGLPSALAAAGLNGIKVVGYAPSSSNLQDIANGGAPFTMYPYGILGWTAVDVAIRVAQGEAVPAADADLPHQLLTKDNLGTIGDSIDHPTDYQTQFKKLWKVA